MQLVMHQARMFVLAGAVALAIAACEDGATDAPGADPSVSATASDEEPSVSATTDAAWACPDKDPLLNLVDAAIDGELETVRGMIERCVPEPAASTFDDQALRRAAHVGEVEVVGYLVDIGADPATSDAMGDTALFWAARWIQAERAPDPATSAAKAEIVRLLLDTRVEVDARGEGGHTALAAAAFSGYTDVVRLLVDAGADIEISTGSGATPLFLAAGSGYADIVEILLDAGADTEARDQRGLTALEVAQEQGHDDIVDLLLSHDQEASQ